MQYSTFLYTTWRNWLLAFMHCSYYSLITTDYLRHATSSPFFLLILWHWKKIIVTVQISVAWLFLPPLNFPWQYLNLGGLIILDWNAWRKLDNISSIQNFSQAADYFSTLLLHRAHCVAIMLWTYTYMGGAWSGHWLSWIRFFMMFFNPSWQTLR